MTEYIKTHLSGDNLINYIENARPNSGNCVNDSFLTYLKFMNLGAKRVRGKINATDLFAGNFEITDKLKTHYWVELNDMVYDINCYQTKIVSKDKFYEVAQISDVEVAEDGIFYTNNFSLYTGPDRVSDMKYIYKLFKKNK